ncbi:MAG: tetratricopeptide repeat protein [Acidobacteriota bacterium]
MSDRDRLTNLLINFSRAAENSASASRALENLIIQELPDHVELILDIASSVEGLGHHVSRALTSIDDFNVLRQVMLHIEALDIGHPVWLRLLSIDAIERLLALYPDDHASSLEELEEQAILLTGLADEKSEIDRVSEASSHVEEAQRLLSRAAVKGQDVRELRIGLDRVQSRLFRARGDDARALATARRAVELSRQLEPSADSRIELSMSLGALVYLTVATGEFREAKDLLPEAEALSRALVEDKPDDRDRLANLAALLHNRADMAIGLEQIADARAPIDEAVSILRQLVNQSPESYRAELAGSLDDQASVLADLGEIDRAARVRDEAIDLRKELVELLPNGANRAALARSLMNAGTVLGKQGDYVGARDSIAEAAELFESIETDQPGSHTATLAMALNNLSIAAGQLGRIDESRDAAERAVDLYRSLGRDTSVAIAIEYAWTVMNLGLVFFDDSAWDRAEEHEREAVELFERLLDFEPDSALPALATCLFNLGRTVAHRGRDEEALEITDRAVEILRPLADAAPEAFSEDLAMALDSRGDLEGRLGRLANAAAATREAVGLLRAQWRKNPTETAYSFAASLGHLAIREFDGGDLDAAIGAAREATELFHELARSTPRYIVDYATSLNNLGNLYLDGDRFDAAHRTLDQSLDVLREAEIGAGPRVMEVRARSLHNRGVTRVAMKHHEEASEDLAEAIQIRAALVGTEDPESTVHVSDLLASAVTYLTLPNHDRAILGKALSQSAPVLLAHLLEIEVEPGARLAWSPGYNRFLDETELEWADVLTGLIQVLREDHDGERA